MINCKKTRILPYVPLRTMGGELSFARFWRKPTPKECALCLSAGARLLAPFRGRSLYEGQRRKYREMSFLEKWWVEANIICPFNTFAKMKKLCPQVSQYPIDKYLRYMRGVAKKLNSLAHKVRKTKESRYWESCYCLTLHDYWHISLGPFKEATSLFWCAQRNCLIKTSRIVYTDCVGGFILYRVTLYAFFMLVYEGVIREHGDMKNQRGVWEMSTSHMPMYIKWSTTLLHNCYLAGGGDPKLPQIMSK